MEKSNELSCKNCAYSWKDEDDEHPCCHFFTPAAGYLLGKDQSVYSAGWLEGYADGEKKGREAGYRAGYQDGRKARMKNDRKHQPKPAREFDDSWAYVGNDDMKPR